VPSSAPELVGLKDIDSCKECIVGFDQEDIQVHFKSIGGTPPPQVTVTVGDKPFQGLQYNDTPFFVVFITLADSYHNTTITCSVMNDALLSPLITTAKVYVISK
jgi:hypothetical protein